MAEKTIEDVLMHFGDNLGEARRRYRQFVKKGIDQGKRPEFQGGGLVRPACHARSMGSLKYENVEREYSTSKKQLGVKARAGRSAGGEKAGLLGRRKEERDPPASPERAQARDGGRGKGDARILGSGAKIASELRLSEKSVSRCIERGKKLLLCR